MITQAVAIPEWEVVSDRSCELEREVMRLRREADAKRCRAELAGLHRCVLDVEHEGDHRLSQFSWMVPPE